MGTQRHKLHIDIGLITSVAVYHDEPIPDALEPQIFHVLCTPRKIVRKEIIMLGLPNDLRLGQRRPIPIR